MLVAAPEALCVAQDGRLLFSAGTAIQALPHWGGAPSRWMSFDRPVTALCASPAGLIAVGFGDGRVTVLDGAGQPASGWPTSSGFTSVSDGVFLSETELAIVDSGYPADENLLAIAAWDASKRGRALVVTNTGETRVLTSGLHCPMGIACDANGAAIITELEQARIVDAAGQPRQSGYPAYLGRIRRTSAGYIMACLARRDPLIEFLKTEHDFIAEMTANIRPQNWIAPRLRPEFSHDFPIELGATRLFGEIKPWAPSFSYGLIIELDLNLMPVRSAQSRANGRRHAITDALIWNGDIIAVSKASGEILNLGPEGAAP